MLDGIRTRPQSVFVRRNDRVDDKLAYPMATDAYIPDVRMEEAPDVSPPSTSFAGVGRDAGHAPTPIHRWAGGLAIPEWLSVVGWPFLVPKVPSALVVSMPRGVQNPIRERSNIYMPKQTTLGALTTVDGNQTWAPNLAKITF